MKKAFIIILASGIFFFLLLIVLNILASSGIHNSYVSQNILEERNMSFFSIPFVFLTLILVKLIRQYKNTMAL